MTAQHKQGVNSCADTHAQHAMAHSHHGTLTDEPPLICARMCSPENRTKPAPRRMTRQSQLTKISQSPSTVCEHSACIRYGTRRQLRIRYTSTQPLNTRTTRTQHNVSILPITGPILVVAPLCISSAHPEPESFCAYRHRTTAGPAPRHNTYNSS